VFFTNKRPKQGTLYRSLLVDVRKEMPILRWLLVKKLYNGVGAGGKEHQHGEEHQQVVGEEQADRELEVT